MRGFIFYRGKSPIDGAEIVGIATLESKNSKTGNMIQTWILRTDTHPLEARQTGRDRSHCGDCPMHSECYIEWGKGPSQVWKTYHRGGYMDLRRKPALMRRIVMGRMVRLGAAGDPSMIPLQYWLRLLETAEGWTGYTHQWREPWAQPMRELAMASVETAADADIARAMGWRYFRVKTKAQPLLRQEMACPNETTGRQCIDCGACDGALKPSAASVVIVVHGPKAKAFERAHA
jgi:hypothetical protein